MADNNVEIMEETSKQQNKKNILKPWTSQPMIKCADWCCPMLDIESIYHLFKCMGKYCCFTTNDSSAMVSHLQNHKDPAGILMCSYCVTSYSTVQNLIEHVTNVHGVCRYQCAFCFYRSLDAANVFFHLETYHKEELDHTNAIVQLPENSSIPKDGSSIALLRPQQKHQVLKCACCRLQYRTVVSFLDHAQKEHPTPKIRCPICYKTVDKHTIGAHFVSHRIGKYECLHCNFVCNFKYSMQRHMCNVHASKQLICCKRRDDKHPNKERIVFNLRTAIPKNYVKYLKSEPSEPQCVPSSSGLKDGSTTLAERSDLAERSATEVKVPKILNVQGGINISKDGVILDAKEVASVTPAEDEPHLERRTTAVVSTAGPSSASSLPATCVSSKDTRTVSDVISNPSPPLKRIKLIPSANVPPASLSSTKGNLVSESATVVRQYGEKCATRSVNQASSVPTNVPGGSNTPSTVHRQEANNVPAVSICHAGASTSKNLPEASSSKAMICGSSSASGRSSSLGAKNDVQTDSTVNSYFIESTVKEIGFHFRDLSHLLDVFYKALLIIFAESPFPTRDIIVCGIAECREQFSNFDLLKQHFERVHKLPMTGEMVAVNCRHCKLQSNSIADFISHLTVHTLNQYICLLCCYKHFLLTTVVTHMNTAHACTSVQLSFGHPRKKNILCDVIIVMPGRMNQQLRRIHVDKILVKAKLIPDSHDPDHAVPPSKSLGDKTKVCKMVPVNFAELYRCGFCLKLVTSKSSLKRHLVEECKYKHSPFYPCAHCSTRLNFRTRRVETIFEHLYYHGETLYSCPECSYMHFLFEYVTMHVRNTHTTTSKVIVVRESFDLWECNVCQLRSFMRQIIMEHMEDIHKLPGEQFMCSICKYPSFTKVDCAQHFKDHHPGTDVVLIEMYHLEPDSSSTNEDSDSDSSVPEIIYEKKDTVSSPTDQSLRENSIVPAKKRALGAYQGSSIFKEHSYFMVVDDASLAGMDHSSNESPKTTAKSTESCTVSNVAEKVSGTVHTSRQKNDSPKTIGKSAESCTVSIVAEKAPGTVRTSQQKNDTFDVLNTQAKKGQDGISEEQKNSLKSIQPIIQSLPVGTTITMATGERRSSRRVAVKKDVRCLWTECTKFGCMSCEKSFMNYNALETHFRILHTSSDATSSDDPATSIPKFRLLNIVCCFYCDKQDTYSALLMHYQKDHGSKSFVCIDYWNRFKCGLCAYLNGSGNEKEFSNHFQHFHNTYGTNFTPYDNIDDNFINWALSFGRQSNKFRCLENKIMKYICGTCLEHRDNELDMGRHLGWHVYKFDCPFCATSFKKLKILYEHVITIHRRKNYCASSPYPLECEKKILEVQMCFFNGFILSKREAQFTRHGSLRVLEKGLEKYYEQEVADLDAFKVSLLATISNCTLVPTEITCKEFIQSQDLFPVVKIKRLDLSEYSDD